MTYETLLLEARELAPGDRLRLVYEILSHPSFAAVTGTLREQGDATTTAAGRLLEPIFGVLLMGAKAEARSGNAPSEVLQATALAVGYGLRLLQRVLPATEQANAARLLQWLDRGLHGQFAWRDGAADKESQ